MLDTILKACENFCIHQIRIAHKIEDKIEKTRTIIAYIDIETLEDKKHRVYIASDLKFMQRVSKLFLEEDESDEDTLIDMALETTNLIVGSAKVIAEESSDNPYTIGTPQFLKADIFDLQYDQAKTIKIQDDNLIVAIKEIN